MNCKRAQERRARSLRKPIVPLLAFVFAFVLSSMSPPAYANYTLEVPSITSGTVVDDVYFYGSIDIGSSVDDVTAGIDKEVYYTTEACGAGNDCPTGNLCSGVASWNPAEIQNDNDSEVELDETLLFADPSIAVLPDDRFIVAWDYYVGGNSMENGQLFGQLLDETGSVVGSEFQINIFQNDNPRDVKVVAFPDGSGFVAVWTYEWLDSWGYGVFAQLLDADGNKVGSEFQVNTYTRNDQKQPSIAPFSDSSGFVVVWESRVGSVPPDTYYYDNIYGQRFDRSGNKLGAEFLVDYETLFRNFGPDVDTTSNGFIVVGSIDYEMYAIKYDLNASPVGSPIVLDNIGSIPYVAVLPSGGFVVAWSEGDDPANATEVMAKIFDSNGVSVGSKFMVNQYLSGYQLASSVASLSDDRFVVTWISEAQNNGNKGVYARIFDMWGNAIGDEFQVSTSTNRGHDNIDVARLSTNDLVFSWVSDDDTTASDNLLYRMFPNTVQLAKHNVPHGNEDIAVQFKLTDPDTSESWCSPVRHYHYVDPSCGSGGTISYPSGYTHESTTTVAITKPTCTLPYQSLQLYARSAPLSDGSCGNFSGWASVGSQTTLTTQEQVSLNDATCYQFRWTLVNYAQNSFDYTSSTVVKVDRQAPAVNFTDSLVGGELQLDLNISDAASGVASKSYRLNNGSPVSVSQNSVTIPLQDGANRVEIMTSDHAGNSATRELFYTADLTAPAIHIHSIKEGETYGAEIPLIYTTTQSLSNLVASLDGNPLSAVPSLLTGLTDGSHTLRIQGLDGNSNPVSTTVSFSVQASMFNVVLLSPQDIEYQQDSVTVQYASNVPIKTVSASLDGGPAQSSLTLAGLSNGAHHVTLNVESVDGRTTWASTNFTINNVVPYLNITNLADGDILTSTNVSIHFESSGAVTYEVGGASGSLVSGASIQLPGEGVHEITLTATHQSGNYVQEMVAVEVDLQEPELNVVSPVEGVYPQNDIPINFSSNAPLQNVQMTLDGNPVSTLDNVPDGNHVFRISAEDRAGRAVMEEVPFVVTHLDIVSPVEGQEINFPQYPPLVSLIYDAGEELNAVTARLDEGEDQLLAAGSGATTHLQVEDRGPHKVHVKGGLNEFSIAKSRNFKVLLKDVSVNVVDGITYRYDDCSGSSECRITPIIAIQNTGDVDIVEEFSLRFDHIKPDGSIGSPTQWKNISSLAVGESSRIQLAPFRANLEDKFTAVVDPQGVLKGELLENNFYETTFRATSIYKVHSRLRQGNVFLSGSSLFNVLRVGVLGNAKSVEFITPGESNSNNLVFVDNNGENGWSAIVDMGLLTPGRNCVYIHALDENENILDIRKLCFKVKELPIPGARHEFPWENFKSPGGGGRVVMSDVVYGQLVIKELQAIKDALVNQRSVLFPKISFMGKVSYVLFHRNNEVPLLKDHHVQDVGKWTLPVSHNLVVMSIDPSGLTCEALVGTVIDSANAVDLFEQSLNRYVSRQSIAITIAMNDPNATYNFDLHIDDLLEDIVPGIFGIAGIGGDSFLFGGAILAGDFESPSALMPFGAYYFGIIDGSISDPVVTITAHTGKVNAGFDPGECSLDVSPTFPYQLSLNMTGTRFWANVNSRIHVDMSGQRMSAYGFGMASFLNIPILPFFGYAKATFHPQQFNIPIYAAAEVGFKVDHNVPSFDYERPPSAVMRMKRTRGPVVLAEAEALIHFGFAGYGQGLFIDWYMDLYGSSDSKVAIDNSGQVDASASGTEYYSRSYNRFKAYYRDRYCILWWCWWEDWYLGDQYEYLYEKGTPYTSTSYIDTPDDVICIFGACFWK